MALEGVRALVFDVFGTVVDWRGGLVREADAFLGRHLGSGEQAEAFAEAWYQTYPASIGAVRRGERPFARLDLMLRSCADERDVLPAVHTLDVHFDEFMTDDLAMVARVYELAGQPFDAAARSAMSEFMVAHPRGKFGTIDYELSQFGLGRGALREQMSFYSERFAVTPES